MDNTELDGFIRLRVKKNCEEDAEIWFLDTRQSIKTNLTRAKQFFKMSGNLVFTMFDQKTIYTHISHFIADDLIYLARHAGRKSNHRTISPILMTLQTMTSHHESHIDKYHGYMMRLRIMLGCSQLAPQIWFFNQCHSFTLNMHRLVQDFQLTEGVKLTMFDMKTVYKKNDQFKPDDLVYVIDPSSDDPYLIFYDMLVPSNNDQDSPIDSKEQNVQQIDDIHVHPAIISSSSNSSLPLPKLTNHYVKKSYRRKCSRKSSFNTSIGEFNSLDQKPKTPIWVTQRQPLSSSSSSSSSLPRQVNTRRSKNVEPLVINNATSQKNSKQRKHPKPQKAQHQHKQQHHKQQQRKQGKQQKQQQQQSTIQQSTPFSDVALEVSAENKINTQHTVQLIDDDCNSALSLTSCDMFDRMKEKELNPEYCIGHAYLHHHTHVTVRMRFILIDWLIGVSEAFKLFSETIFLAIHILNRFLEKDISTGQMINRENLQLLGCACLWIACKHEETRAPKSKQFINYTDNTYTTKQLVVMEMVVLRAFDFKINAPTSLQFFRQYSEAAHNSFYQHTQGKYFLEIALRDYELIIYRPSLIAAAAVYVVEHLKRHKSCCWTRELQHYSHYDQSIVHECATQLLLAIVRCQQNSIHNNINIKYGKKFRCRVAKKKLSQHLKLEKCSAKCQSHASSLSPSSSSSSIVFSTYPLIVHSDVSSMASSSTTTHSQTLKPHTMPRPHIMNLYQSDRNVKKQQQQQQQQQQPWILLYSHLSVLNAEEKIESTHFLLA